MDLQQIVNKAEHEIELRKSELNKREEALNKREAEIESRIKIAQESELESRRLLDKNEIVLRDIAKLEAVKRSDDEISERIMKADQRDAESKKLFDKAETANMEANRVYEEARALKSKIDKEAIEFKGKLVSNLQEMINKA